MTLSRRRRRRWKKRGVHDERRTGGTERAGRAAQVGGEKGSRGRSGARLGERWAAGADRLAKCGVGRGGAGRVGAADAAEFSGGGSCGGWRVWVLWLDRS